LASEINVGDKIISYSRHYELPWARLKIVAIDFKDRVITGKELHEKGDNDASGYIRQIRYTDTFYVYSWAREASQLAFPDECFYQRIHASSDFMARLPKNHFQSTHYKQEETLLKRAPGTGTYDIFKIGERYQLYDPSHSIKPACEGVIVKTPDELYPYFHFRTVDQKELIFPVHEFYGFVKSRVFEEKPAVDYVAIAKNWRRFSV